MNLNWGPGDLKVCQPQFFSISTEGRTTSGAKCQCKHRGYSTSCQLGNTIVSCSMVPFFLMYFLMITEKSPLVENDISNSSVGTELQKKKRILFTFACRLPEITFLSLMFHRIPFPPCGWTLALPQHWLWNVFFAHSCVNVSIFNEFVHC